MSSDLSRQARDMRVAYFLLVVLRVHEVGMKALEAHDLVGEKFGHQTHFNLGPPLYFCSVQRSHVNFPLQKVESSFGILKPKDSRPPMSL